MSRGLGQTRQAVAHDWTVVSDHVSDARDGAKEQPIAVGPLNDIERGLRMQPSDRSPKLYAFLDYPTDLSSQREPRVPQPQWNDGDSWDLPVEVPLVIADDRHLVARTNEVLCVGQHVGADAACRGGGELVADKADVQRARLGLSRLHGRR
jgi:hypothetical protein